MQTKEVVSRGIRGIYKVRRESTNIGQHEVSDAVQEENQVILLLNPFKVSLELSMMENILWLQRVKLDKFKFA